MTKFIAALVAAATLLVAAESQACHPVQAIVAAPVYAQQFAAPVVYQPQVVQQFVAPVSYAVAAPVVQQVVVRQRVVNRHRQPVRRALQVVTPPYGHCR